MVCLVSRRLHNSQLLRAPAVKQGRDAARDQAAGQFVVNPYRARTVEHAGWAEGFDAESRGLHGGKP